MLTYKQLIEKYRNLIKIYEISPNHRQIEYRNLLKIASRELFCGKRTTDNPMFVFATGPAGSGKSFLEKSIKSTFLRDFVVLDIDYFRQYHPDMSEIKKYPTIECILTDIFAKNLQEDILNYALQNGYNVIWSASLNSSEKAIAMIKNIPSIYTIGIYVMAINTLESRVSAEERYEVEIRNPDIIPRFPDENFMKKCDCYGQVIDEIEHANLEELKFIQVFKRSLDKKTLPILVYNSSTDTHQTALSAIRRVENISHSECYNLINRIVAVLNTRISRRAIPEEIEKVHIILSLIMAELW